jgi:cytochrome c553
MNTTKTLLLTAACAMAAVAVPGLAANYEAGKKKAAEVCQACHGENGDKPLTPETPILAGQVYDYLVHSLEAYKKGTRQNPLMSPMAQPLTEQEIRDLAYFFSKQKGLVVKY